MIFPQRHHMWNRNQRLEGIYCVVDGYILNEFVDHDDGVYRMPRPADVAGLNGMRCARGLLRILVSHTDRPMLMCTSNAGGWGIPNHHQWMLVRGHPQHRMGGGRDCVKLRGDVGRCVTVPSLRRESHRLIPGQLAPR